MKRDVFSGFLDFLRRLGEAKIDYTLRHSREDAMMVVTYAPGEYWEIEFLADGEVEIERYRSDGRIHDEPMLTELFALWSDDATPAETSANVDGNVAHS